MPSSGSVMSPTIGTILFNSWGRSFLKVSNNCWRYFLIIFDRNRSIKNHLSVRSYNDPDISGCSFPYLITDSLEKPFWFHRTGRQAPGTLPERLPILVKQCFAKSTTRSDDPLRSLTKSKAMGFLSAPYSRDRQVIYSCNSKQKLTKKDHIN